LGHSVKVFSAFVALLIAAPLSAQAVEALKGRGGGFQLRI
jgi:hypothetical protein